MFQREAVNSIGGLVVANEPFYGTYIGIIEDLYTRRVEVAKVKILACIEYPSQHAEIWPDEIVRRLPYPYNSVQNFKLGLVAKYEGEVPSYEESVEDAKTKRMQEYHEAVKPTAIL